MKRKSIEPIEFGLGPAAPEVLEPVDAPAAPTAGPEVGEATDELQNDIAALNERLLRLQADFDNFRKRTARERAEIRERSLEDLMRQLLPVLDHFELGLAEAEKQGVEGSVREGFQLVSDQLRTVLGRFGLTAVATSDCMFDPHLHEAVTILPSADRPRDAILEETRRGYTLAGRLLRASHVVVSSGSASNTGLTRDAEADHA